MIVREFLKDVKIQQITGIRTIETLLIKHVSSHDTALAENSPSKCKIKSSRCSLAASNRLVLGHHPIS